MGGFFFFRGQFIFYYYSYSCSLTASGKEKAKRNKKIDVIFDIYGVSGEIAPLK